MKLNPQTRTAAPRLFRFSALLSLSLSPACPGTLDDPESFYGSPNAPSGALPTTPAVDAGSDAGTWTSSAPTTDGGWSQRNDYDAAPSAWSPEAGYVDAAAEAGARVSDASAATTDAASDAGSGCNFKALMQAKCGSSSCHGTGGAAANLDLVSDGLAARVASRKASGACGESLLIDTTTPEDSALYRKVTADACGARMPLGGTLADAEQTCILRWIEGL